MNRIPLNYSINAAKGDLNFNNDEIRRLVWPLQEY
jgi:hypothetical protein